MRQMGTSAMPIRMSDRTIGYAFNMAHTLITTTCVGRLGTR